MNIIIHVLNINYFPELFELTYLTIERYSKKIGAKLNIISDRRFPDYPILAEKLQIYQTGADADWNLLLDADILVHPNAINPFTYFDPRFVGIKDDYKASTQLRPDIYFVRDGRDLGISGCLVATSRLTHDLWEFPPPDLTREEILDNILQDRKIVDEYIISRNLAKYGLKYKELFPISRYNDMYHLGAFEQDKNKMLDKAKDWIKKNF